MLKRFKFYVRPHCPTAPISKTLDHDTTLYLQLVRPEIQEYSSEDDQITALFTLDTENSAAAPEPSMTPKSTSTTPYPAKVNMQSKDCTIGSTNIIHIQIELPRHSIYERQNLTNVKATIRPRSKTDEVGKFTMCPIKPGTNLELNHSGVVYPRAHVMKSIVTNTSSATGIVKGDICQAQWFTMPETTPTNDPRPSYKVGYNVRYEITKGTTKYTSKPKTLYVSIKTTSSTFPSHEELLQWDFGHLDRPTVTSKLNTALPELYRTFRNAAEDTHLFHTQWKFNHVDINRIISIFVNNQLPPGLKEAATRNSTEYSLQTYLPTINVYQQPIENDNKDNDSDFFKKVIEHEYEHLRQHVTNWYFYKFIKDNINHYNTKIYDDIWWDNNNVIIGEENFRDLIYNDLQEFLIGLHAEYIKWVENTSYEREVLAATISDNVAPKYYHRTLSEYQILFKNKKLYPLNTNDYIFPNLPTLPDSLPDVGTLPHKLPSP